MTPDRVESIVRHVLSALIRRILSTPWILFRALLLPLILSGFPVHAAPPHPVFPVGSISALPQIVQTGTRPELSWAFQLPDNQSPANYLFFIRQRLYPSGRQIETSVSQSGQMLSPLPEGPESSSFELWAIQGSPMASYLVDTTFFAPFVPMATVTIQSDDPYPFLPRTRADRPFHVDVNVQGILSVVNDPGIMKAVTFVRHVQSYGASGTGDNLDRSGATLLSQASITNNGGQSFPVTPSAIPGGNPPKARGEESFSIHSLSDDSLPASVISTRFIQIWPVADGGISGLTEGQTIGPEVPDITITLHDLYPDSSSWAQVYKGGPRPAVTGTIIPDSTVNISSSIPQDRIIHLSNYGSLLDSDGQWTMELLTRTPFGTDRVTSVSFTIQGKGMTVEGWRQSHFGNTDDSGDGANSNDYDQDGLSNLIEFAFGLDPKLPGTGKLPVPQTVGNLRVISFTEPAGVNGITYGAEWSSSLLPGSWQRIPDSGEAPQHLFCVPGDSSPNLFLRLTVGTP